MSYDSGSNYNYPKDIAKARGENNPAATAEGSKGNNWRRYRFETKAVDDYRPLIFNPKYPWWCSGHRMGGDLNIQTSTIVAYLPFDEDLKKYWDDAFNITFTDHATIEFSDRFPKPKYFVD